MKMAVTTLMLLVLAGGSLYANPADQPPPTPAEEQPEVLTSGPVHEAFAEPVNLQVQAGLVAPEEPPAKIEEVPPVERPQGDQFVWVPGYWAWDADRSGYIWVSACWRAAPPKMSWVPGYWARVPEGWEWVPGFWTPAGSQKIEYLPAPPALDNVDPPGIAPSADVIWVPPCQYWQKDHYILRAGYWVKAQTGWLWVPSHYMWTPRGYVFVEGHWDYTLPRRGVLFAPVRFPRSSYARPGFSYALSIVVDIGTLKLSLFTCPRYSHYYFGDYYDDAYLNRGIYPRCDNERIHTWYDPIYQHDRWRNLETQPQWVENQRHEYDLRRADKDLRPPRTYHEMAAREAKLPEAQRKNVQMARPMSAAVASKTTELQFKTMKSSEQKKVTRQATDVHKFGAQRTQWESPAVSKKEIQPLPQSRGTVAPASGRQEPQRAVVERKAPATAPAKPAPTERKESVAAPTPSPSAERKSPVTTSTAHAAGFVAPRDVKVTKSETVKIPKPPIVGKPATDSKREAPAPAKPTEERQTPRDTKGKDTNKNK